MKLRCLKDGSLADSIEKNENIVIAGLLLTRGIHNSGFLPVDTFDAICYLHHWGQVLRRLIPLLRITSIRCTAFKKT